MKLSNVRELYKNTGLNEVSKDVRNAVLKALKIPLEEHISDTKKQVEMINTLLDDINILKEFYPKEEFQELDLSIFLNTQNKAILRIRLAIIKEICGLLGIENTSQNALKYLNSKLLSVFTFDQDEDFAFDSIKICLEGLKKIEGFNFDSIFEVDVYNLRGLRGRYEQLFECIKYFGIKSAKDLEVKGVEEILGYNDGKMTYFEYGKAVFGEKEEFLALDKYEGWFGRKFTLKEAENGTIKNIKAIYDGIEKYAISLERIKIIFDYINKNDIGIGELSDFSCGIFIEFCRGFTNRVITEENVEETVEILREIVGIDIDLEWILNNDLFKLLQILTGESKEISYKDIDIKETLYKPFFQKFPQFVGLNEKGEKYSEDLNKKHFKGDENELSGILMHNVSVDFINLFSHEFEDISDVINNQNFQLFYQNIGNGKKKTIVDFIKFVRKYNLFQINLADVNKDFLIFFNKNFKDEEQISQDINLPSDFLDEKPSLRDFENPLLKSLVLKKSVIFENLEAICKLYNLPVKLSSFRRLVLDYEKKYGYNEWFYKFLTKFNLKITIKFISSILKDISSNNLIYILVHQSELLDSMLLLSSELNLSKEQFFIKRFGLDTSCYFKNDENGNYIFNENRKDLLRLIFDDSINIEQLEKFLNSFSGVTLGKLVEFYKAKGFKYGYEHWPVLKFLIQYALDKNYYKYLENNINIMNIDENDIYVLSFYLSFNLAKLKTILDKTGGFLTETFVLRFIIGNCSESELDEMIKDYDKFRSILLSGGTLDGIEDKYGLVQVVIKDVYPHRTHSPRPGDKYENKTTHLERYKFNRNGYTLHLTGGANYKLKNGVNLDEKTTNIYSGLFELLEEICGDRQSLEDYLKKKASENEIKLETTTLEAQILEYYKKLEIKLHREGKTLKVEDLDIILAFGLVGEFDKFKTSYNSSENKNFSNISTFLTEFGDKFKESLKSLISSISAEDKVKIAHLGSVEKTKRNKQITSGIERIFNIFTKIPVDARNIGKFKKLVENQLKALFDDHSLNNILENLEKFDINNLGDLEQFKEDFNKIIELSSQLDFGFLAIESTKYYSLLEKELSKFEKVIDEDKTGQKRTLDCYFMKTKESSRARGVAGNCAGNDSSMWENKNYFELVLFDRELMECIGVVELLVMNDKKGKFLLYGPTPRETYLQKVDNEELYKMITEIVIGFAQENLFDGILTNTKHGQMGNASGKFAEAFQKSVLPGKRISLDKSYTLFGEYIFQNDLEVIWLSNC